MHPEQFKAFDRICAERRARGSVLEVGAVPSEASLLCLPSLEGAVRKVGINLEGPSSYRDFSILEADANDLRCFRDGEFDAVLCNAVFEHDLFFWKAFGEMLRVTRSGGLVVIGVPGFVKEPPSLWRALIRRAPLLGTLLPRRWSSRIVSARVLAIHDCPSDYYRFSPQAVAGLLETGLNDVRVYSHMRPPRIIGSGIKP